MIYLPPLLKCLCKYNLLYIYIYCSIRQIHEMFSNKLQKWRGIFSSFIILLINYNLFIHILLFFTVYRMHRVSVFRDDVVFLIYMIQRRIYPVDSERTEGYDNDDDNNTNHKNPSNSVIAELAVDDTKMKTE